MSRKQLSKEMIISTTLALIEEKESINKVNFREIARRLGCAHTSLYNFYPSFNELILATGNQMVINMRQSLAHESKQLIGDNTYKSYTLAYIYCVLKYASAHKGWYRFLWLDYLDIDLSGIFKNLQRPEILLLPYYLEDTTRLLSESEASIRLNIAHGFIHGELCKYLSNRSQTVAEPVFITTTLTHVKWLLNLEM